MIARAQLSATVRRIIDAGLRAVEPAAATSQALLRHRDRLEARGLDGSSVSYGLDAFDRVIVVGAGKAAAGMAEAVEERLDDRIAGGVIVVPDGVTASLRQLRLVPASHPLPDETSEAAAKALVAALGGLDERTLVVCLLSGGASALLALPAPGLDIAAKRLVTEALLKSGADIAEINYVRKHLSALKGGRLAVLARPAQLLTLIISDVVGDRLDVVGSGPTLPDPSTFAAARAVLTEYQLWGSVPDSVRLHLERGGRGRVDETPKPGDPAFKRATALCIANNQQAIAACAFAAVREGWRPLLVGAEAAGDVHALAKQYLALAAQLLRQEPLAPPVCVIAGGEPSLKVRGEGRGGRNQELALAVACGLAGESRAAFVSLGTDGIDGNTDAAGAIAYGDTVSRAQALGLEPRAHLAQHNAYPLFAALGDHLMLGPTGTNVMDIHLLLVA